MLKDAALGSFLSLDWTLGFSRDFGREVLSPRATALGRIFGYGATKRRQTILEAQSKTSSVLACTGSSASARPAAVKEEPREQNHCEMGPMEARSTYSPKLATAVGSQRKIRLYAGEYACLCA
jgi:hypothetical protein